MKKRLLFYEITYDVIGKQKKIFSKKYKDVSAKECWTEGYIIKEDFNTDELAKKIITQKEKNYKNIIKVKGFVKVPDFSSPFFSDVYFDEISYLDIKKYNIREATIEEAFKELTPREFIEIYKDEFKEKE